MFFKAEYARFCPSAVFCLLLRPSDVMVPYRMPIVMASHLRMSWGVSQSEIYQASLWLLYMQEDNDIWQYVVALTKVLCQLQMQLALRLWNKSVISKLWQKIAHTPKTSLNTWKARKIYACIREFFYICLYCIL